MAGFFDPLFDVTTALFGGDSILSKGDFVILVRPVPRNDGDGFK